MDAVRGLGMPAEVVVGAERHNALEAQAGGGTIVVDFERPERCFGTVFASHRDSPFGAVVSSDDTSSLLAATLCRELGLPHHSVEAVQCSRDKLSMRRRMSEAGIPVPRFAPIDRDLSAEAALDLIANDVGFPCVLKPVALSASRGVIRVNAADQVGEVLERVRLIIAEAASTPTVLAESYLTGDEVAVEGLMTDGQLRILAIFDKPDPLDGPFFEETIYVTPSRRPPDDQPEIESCVRSAVEALGLNHGPIHAEVRLTPDGCRLIEVAARSIGGLCSRALRFSTGMSLEALILRNALGLPVETTRDQKAAGVMMIPVTRSGIFRELGGVEEAKRVEHIEAVNVTYPRGQALVPLPEGNRYVGFIFSRADTPELAEAALREAYAKLEIVSS
jgi:biotin carboxylase